MSTYDEELLEGDVDEDEGLDPSEARDGDQVSATAASDSTIAHLQELAGEVADETSKVFAIPGWRGCLGARLKFVEPNEFKKYGIALGKGKDPLKNLRANMTLLIDACEEVVGRPDDGAQWEPLLDDGPIQFDERLAQALKFPPEVNTARRVVTAVFGGPKKAVWRINGLVAEDFSDWLNGEDEEASSALGESSPSTGA